MFFESVVHVGESVFGDRRAVSVERASERFDRFFESVVHVTEDEARCLIRDSR